MTLVTTMFYSSVRHRVVTGSWGPGKTQIVPVLPHNVNDSLVTIRGNFGLEPGFLASRRILVAIEPDCGRVVGPAEAASGEQAVDLVCEAGHRQGGAEPSAFLHHRADNRHRAVLVSSRRPRKARKVRTSCV